MDYERIQSIKRPALGTFAKIGDLYDSRTDQFKGDTILKSTLPPNLVTKLDVHHCHSETFTSEKIQDKFKHLEIKSSLKINVLAELVCLEGSAKYLHDAKSSARSVRCTLVHKIRTKYEEMSLCDEINQWIDPTELDTDSATHYVRGIEWGANLLVRAEYLNIEMNKVTEVAGKLQAQMKRIADVQATFCPETEFKKEELGKNVQFSILVHGDVIPKGKHPQSLSEAQEFMGKLPDMMVTANEGKGIPMRYYLEPIPPLRSKLGLQTQPNILVPKISSPLKVHIVNLFEEVSTAKQLLHDLSEDVDTYRFCLHDEDIKAVKQFKVCADISVEVFQTSFSSNLRKLRQGETSAESFEELIAQFKESLHSPSKTLEFAQKCQESIGGRIETYHSFSDLGVECVRKGETSLQNILLKHNQHNVYVLYSQNLTKEKQKDLWEEYFLKFLDLREYHKFEMNHKFLYIDVDILPRLSIPDGIGLRYYEKGRLISKNVCKEEKPRRCWCV